MPRAAWHHDGQRARNCSRNVESASKMDGKWRKHQENNVKTRKKSGYIEKTHQNSTKNRIFHKNSPKRTSKNIKTTPFCSHRHFRSKKVASAHKKVVFGAKSQLKRTEQIWKKSAFPLAEIGKHSTKNISPARITQKNNKKDGVFCVFGQQFTFLSSVCVPKIIKKRLHPGFPPAGLEKNRRGAEKSRVFLEAGRRTARPSSSMTFRDNFFLIFFFSV